MNFLKDRADNDRINKIIHLFFTGGSEQNKDKTE